MRWQSAILMMAAAGALACDAAAATICKTGPDTTGETWRWRDIDGRRCWFPGRRNLPKSELRWQEDAPPPKAAPKTNEELIARGYEILRTRVRRDVDGSGRNILDASGAGPVDLLTPELLSGPDGIGSAWRIPIYNHRLSQP